MLRKCLLWIANLLKNRKQRIGLFGCFTGWIVHFQWWGPWGIDTDTGFIKCFHQWPGEERSPSEISKFEDDIKPFCVVECHCQLAEGTSELRRKVAKLSREGRWQMRSSVDKSKGMHQGRIIWAVPHDAEVRMTIQHSGKASWSHPWQVSEVVSSVCSSSQNQQNAGHHQKRF